MTLLALAPIIFIAFAIEATAGFGSVMISLAIGTLFWPVSSLLPVIVPISLCLSGYMLTRHWRSVNGNVLLRQILPLMGVGIALGIFLVPYLSPDKLRLLLGIVVIGAALRGLAKMLWHKGEEKQHNIIVRSLWIAGAGVVHGLLATGGPPLVYALEGAKMGKASFRSTLAAVWFSLNLVHLVRFLYTGVIRGTEVLEIAPLLPVVGIAILVGEYCHARVSESHFRFTVFALLTIAGILLVLPMLVSW